ncbi:MAG TPA: Eco57I restriction-modification methylase domain-containing protein, partial [bacterium]|nr:Eco57I restriction-modification methylase domain-containing protein [bacterium]
DASLLQGPQWDEFVAGFSREPSVGRVLKALAGKLGNLKEVGSLARPEVDLRTIIHDEKLRWAEAICTKKEKNYLFPEMKPPEQLELSFESAISDEEFWDELSRKVQAALHGFFEVSRAQGRVRAAVFATDAERGFEFMDLCLRRYDVVATNPPYMGSKNMNGGLKEFVQAFYPEGKRDLYAAFILRCIQLATRDGYVAMVTQHSWMFLRSFARLRALTKDELAAAPEGRFKGLLREARIRALAHLGPCAFTEVSGEVVNSVLFTISKTPPDESHCFTALRLVGLRSPAEKQAALLQCSGFSQNNIVSVRLQHAYTNIPESPLAYWLSTELIGLLCGKCKLMDIAEVKAGLSTAHNDRFLRFHWEIDAKPQTWFPYLKGGRYQKWAGLQWLVIDWEKAGARPRLYPKAVVRNPDCYGRRGLTYSLFAQGSMSVRFSDGCIFDDASLSIFPRFGVPREAIAGLMNTRLISFILRSLTQDLKFRVGYVVLTPLPCPWPELECRLGSVQLLAAQAIRIKRNLISRDIVEASLDLSGPENEGSLLDSIRKSQDSQLRLAAVLHTIEGSLEHAVLSIYKVNEDDVQAILSETGVPAGWNRRVVGLDDLPELRELGIPASVPRMTDGPINGSDLIVQRLRQAYENTAEPSDAQDDPDVVEQADQDEDGQTEEKVLGASIPIPCETLLEKLSTDLELHPVSAYLLIKEGIEKRGWRCHTEERRYSEDYVSVLTLRLLGHRWPKQIEAGEPVPDWA